MFRIFFNFLIVYPKTLNFVKFISDEKLIVFVVSTCGDGDMPSNMILNWRKLLIRHLSSNFLTKV